MTHDPHHVSPIFRIDVSADFNEDQPGEDSGDVEVKQLLRHIIENQEQQTQVLKELVQHMGGAQRQRATELGHWKEANPELANQCRSASEALSQVQTEFLQSLTEEVNENFEHLLEGEFMLNEFVDRFGPRLAHLNGVLQVLSQLSSANNSTNTVQ